MLGELLYGKNPKLKYQESFKKWIPILCDDQAIGRINGLFVLVVDPCSRCISCGEIFRLSTILKHVNHRANSNCKNEYTIQELQLLEEQSNAMKKQNDLKFRAPVHVN